MGPSLNKNRPSEGPGLIPTSKQLRRDGKRVVTTSLSSIGNWSPQVTLSPIATSTGNLFVTAPLGKKKSASDSQLPRSSVLARQAVFLFLRRSEKLETEDQETLTLLRSLHRCQWIRHMSWFSSS